jgi:hypothetical protein
MRRFTRNVWTLRYRAAFLTRNAPSRQMFAQECRHGVAASRGRGAPRLSQLRGLPGAGDQTGRVALSE